MSFVGKAIGSLTGANKQAKAATQAANTQLEASREATKVQKDMYDQTRKDLMPYTDAGRGSLSQLMGQMGPNGYFNQTYKGGKFNFQADPSYAFRRQQGLDGIQSQAAAEGGLLSGATLKALNQYNSNLASQEYSDAFNRWQSTDNNNYERFNADQTNRYNRLSNIVGLGQNAAAQQGNAGMQTAQAVANNTMSGANAQAAGQIAAGNRTANNFGSVLGAATSIGSLFI